MTALQPTAAVIVRMVRNQSAISSNSYFHEREKRKRRHKCHVSPAALKHRESAIGLSGQTGPLLCHHLFLFGFAYLLGGARP